MKNSIISMMLILTSLVLPFNYAAAFDFDMEPRLFTCSVHGGPERVIMLSNNFQECVNAVGNGELRDAYCKFLQLLGQECPAVDENHITHKSLLSDKVKPPYFSTKTVHIPEHCAQVDPFE